MKQLENAAMKMKLFLIITTLLVIIGRFTVPDHDFSWPNIYEAVAHIWVGMLITVIVYNKQLYKFLPQQYEIYKLGLFLFIILNIVEITMAIIQNR